MSQQWFLQFRPSFQVYIELVKVNETIGTPISRTGVRLSIVNAFYYLFTYWLN